MSTRAERITAGFEEAGIDLLLISHPVNLRYVTGFTGSNGLAVIGPGLGRFVTDFRYVEQAAAEVPEFEREHGPRELLDALRGPWPEGGARLGFDDAHVSVRAHGRLREVVADRVELVQAAGLIEAARAIKTPEEIASIRAAAQLADTVYRELADQGLVGRTEREVALSLEHRMRQLGAQAPSFDSIVASGGHGALPHASPRDVPITSDVLVTLDIGAIVDGYCSDCTRTWATGGSLPDDLAEVYALTLQAQEAAVAAVRPGPTGHELDTVARDIIEGGGHGERFGHPLGHGVGLEVHEDPRLSRINDRPLEDGNVVTVEPGIYLPGRGGVRIEDLVVVTPDGHDVLTQTPKELLVVF